MEDYHKLWKHRWINPKAKSKKSTMQGIGVVAIESISKNEIIGILGGVIISKSKIQDYREKLGHVGIQISDGFWICPTSKEELQETGVFNHSCNPNIGFSNTITLVAMSDIKLGEELVFDYAFCESYMKPFECKCSSENCRKTIKQDDWKIKKLQDKYKKYFSPYLRDKL